jgi:serine/threonine protein kinase
VTDEDQPTFAIAADPLVGRVLDGRFRIVRRVATGGMGRVYIAEQRGLERTVALKVLGVEGGRRVDASFRDRFFREAKLCSKLTHPNTVRIYDYGQTEDGVFYIAMEFLDGQTLSAILKSGPLDPVRIVNFAVQVCGSLAEAHSLGLIHRDLKPDNLIVTRTADGREFVRVLDFGVAKDTTNTDLPTEAGMVYGSPGYMSPEQILDQALSPRSDIYSLGAILYRMATGTKPFGSTNAVALLTRHVYSPPQPFREANPHLEIPRSLEWVTLTCLAKDPADRFATSAEVARALKVCELEARGLLANAELRLHEGRLQLSREVEEGLLRFGGDISVITPGPIPSLQRATDPSSLSGVSRSSVMPTGEEPSGDRVAEPTVEVPSGTVSLSRRLRHPVVLLVGGLLPLMAAAGLVVLLGVVTWLAVLAWRAGQVPMADVAPVIETPAEPHTTIVQPAPVQPAPVQPAPGAPAPAEGAPAEPVPSTAPVPRPRPRPRSAAPAPVPVPVPVPVPEPVVIPAPAPVPVPRPRSDLRNPFED